MTKRDPIEIRVLSVKQPWADCIMLDKWVENRSWRTHYRGPLWIQAGLKTDYGPDVFYEHRQVPGERLRGCIIGRVDLLDCASQRDVIAVRDYIKGKRKTVSDRQEEIRNLMPRSNAKKWKYLGDSEFCWIVANPRWLKEPIPCTGKLGIFKIEVDSDMLKLKRS
jgi:hypothetical protein